MAKFLDTDSISLELKNIIRNSKEKLYLISPYLCINSKFKDVLDNKLNTNNLEVTLIYRNMKDLNDDDKKILNGWLSEINLYTKENLHAKCYFNEKEAIICSMNLYSFSRDNNYEFGILISKEDDTEVYEDMISHVDEMKINSKKVKYFKGYKKPKKKIKTIKKDTSNLNKKEKITYNILKNYRDEISENKNLKKYIIFKNNSIYDICKNKHKIKEISDLKKVKGFGKKRIKKYGEFIVNLVNHYKDYSVGRVLETKKIRNDSDKVKLKLYKDNSKKWYKTVKTLPNENDLVFVKLNRNWFNHYIIFNR